MGEFTNGSTPVDPNQSNTNDIGNVSTDVEDIFADGINKKDSLPIFNVSENDFFKNMKVDRRRLRFSQDSNVSNYMKKTKYKNSFYIRSQDSGYMRKVK